MFVVGWLYVLREVHSVAPPLSREDYDYYDAQANEHDEHEWHHIALTSAYWWFNHGLLLAIYVLGLRPLSVLHVYLLK